MIRKKTEMKAFTIIGAIAIGGMILSHIYVGANQRTINIETMPIISNKADEVEEITQEKIGRENLNNFLFIGDSFTYLIKDTIKTKNENAYIYAKSGSRPSYWLDKISEMPDEKEVEGIVLLIGVNGASTESNKEDVVKLMNLISEKYPSTKTYVQKIFPVGKNFHAKEFNNSINILNDIIKKHANKLNNFTFIDTTEGFVDTDGNLLHTYDELHIDSEYNNIFYENIFNQIKKAELNA